jgi:hypothetical protein
MLKFATRFLVAVLFLAAVATPTLAQRTVGGHDESTEDFTGASWAAAAVASPGTVAAGVTGVHLLITEIGWRGLNSATLTDSTEFIEFFNPTNDFVDLGKYYVSDVNAYSTLPVAGTVDLVANSTDFAMRFPAGAGIAPGAVKVIAVDGGRYKRATGVDADFMLFNAGGATTALPMVDVATNKGATYPTFGSFTNGGEFVWLFYWDAVSDLVCDVDLAYWGPGTGANLPSRKLATTCQDGPDAGTATSCYLLDAGNPAGSMARALTVPASGAGTRQRVGPESEFVTTAGNGCVPGGPTEAHTPTWGALKSRYR